MSRRWIIVCLIAISAIIAAEAYLKLALSPPARIEIINESGEILEDLIVIYRETEIPIGNVAAGELATAWVTADQPGTVKLDFHQKNNGMNGLEISDFDLPKDATGGFKLVIVIRKNQVERYLDDDNRLTPAKLGERIKEWLGFDRIQHSGLF